MLEHNKKIVFNLKVRLYLGGFYLYDYIFMSESFQMFDRNVFISFQ